MADAKKPQKGDRGLTALVLAIEREAYYRLNARIVYLQRRQLDGRVAYLAARLCWWRVMPREGFYQFDDNGAW